MQCISREILIDFLKKIQIRELADEETFQDVEIIFK